MPRITRTWRRDISTRVKCYPFRVSNYDPRAARALGFFPSPPPPLPFSFKPGRRGEREGTIGI